MAKLVRCARVSTQQQSIDGQDADLLTAGIPTGFQGRIQDWLGKEPDECRAGQHPDHWNDVASLIRRHTEDLDEISGQLRNPAVPKADPIDTDEYAV